MKNKIIMMLLAIFISVALVFVSPAIEGHGEKEKTESITVQEEAIAEPVDVEVIKQVEIDETSIIQEKIKSLELIENQKEKLLYFKEIQKEYPNVFEEYGTIYDWFSDEELNRLYMVVEAEITEGDFAAKVNVANTILNRYFDGRFGETLIDVLNPSQFTTISDGRYKKVTVTEDTILACEYTYMFDDTTSGALYFETVDSNVHFKYAEYLFTDGYHKFYK